jgi:glutamyl-tRNA synthetase
VEEAVALILSGFRWLGIDWDEGPDKGGPHGPYYQSQRSDKYESAIIRLMTEGYAYPDETPEKEVDEERKAAEAAKRAFVFRGKGREMDPAKAVEIYHDRKPAVRFKVPAGRTVLFDDKVRGQVEWQTDLLGDFTIARRGGKPLYNLASVVDDIDMEITHIVRAEEHLSNTHPQIHLFDALAGSRPVFAHIPYVAAPGTKKKLSKRNPPPGVMVSLEEYERAGYLPAAVLNALARLGWSLDDKTELMDLGTLVSNFSLERVISSPAGLDVDKMYWMQDQYMRQLPADERVARMIPFLQAAGLVGTPISDADRQRVVALDQACGERLKLLSDIVRYGSFCFAEQLDYDKEASKHLRREGIESALTALRAALETVEPFDLGTIEAKVGEVGSATDMGGKINHVLRAAVTGRSVGPGVYDCVLLLGREKSLAHLDQTLAAARAGQFAAPAANA